MLHQVPLDRPPKNLHIPEQYRDRFRYDERRHCLSFDGPMFKTTFDRLSALSQDFDYQRSLEELFRLSIPEDAESHGRAKLAALAFGLLGLAAAAGAWFLLF